VAITSAVLRLRSMHRACWLSLLIACTPSIVPPATQTNVVVIPPPTQTDTVATSVVPVNPPLPPIVESATTSPLEIPERDVRVRGPRSKPLLLTEIQNLESLSAATPPTASDAPIVLKRIGDDYLELHRADQTVEAGNRAIAVYMKYVKNYSSQPNVDEVMYSLGLEYELVGDLMSSRKTFYELIMKQPSSRFIPFAYFAFGEMFFVEAKTDPSKWDLSKQAYAQALKYPSHALTPWTLLRMGQVEAARGNQASAQAQWTTLRTQYPTSSAVARIGTPP
jgi:TolA-binding protein